MVRCKMSKCFYWDNRGICLNPTLALDENGMCQLFWYRGNYQPKESKINQKREQVILQAEIEEK